MKLPKVFCLDPLFDRGENGGPERKVNRVRDKHRSVASM